MAFPLIKVFYLTVRVFSKPILNWVKIASKNNHNSYKHTWSRKIFYKLGNFSNRLESKIN